MNFTPVNSATGGMSSRKNSDDEVVFDVDLTLNVGRSSYDIRFDDAAISPDLRCPKPRENFTAVCITEDKKLLAFAALEIDGKRMIKVLGFEELEATEKLDMDRRPWGAVVGVEKVYTESSTYLARSLRYIGSVQLEYPIDSNTWDESEAIAKMKIHPRTRGYLVINYEFSDIDIGFDLDFGGKLYSIREVPHEFDSLDRFPKPCR